MALSKLFETRRRNRLFGKAVPIALAVMLAAGSVPAPPAADALSAATGTPGGVDASALRLWLKADADNVALAGGQVTAWQDSSVHGHRFVNDGSLPAIASRNKPMYEAAHPELNHQPALKFVRSGAGSILQDADGIFEDGEEIGHASVYTVTGGLASIDNSMIFSHSLAGGAFSAHLPHKSGSTSASLGSVLWDSGKKSDGTGYQRLSAGDQVFLNQYNVWGLHHDAAPADAGAYQSATRDGLVIGQSNTPILPFVGQAGGAMSLGSAVSGGSGYNGYMSEMIVFTEALTDVQKRQVDSYLAIKYGLALPEGSYLSAGPAPVPVWDAEAHAAYSRNVAGIGRDAAGALDQRQSRSSLGGADSAQALIGTPGGAELADGQYLLWGDDGNTGPSLSYGSGYTRMSRTWKAQNTGGIGPVQIAIPRGAIPLGGLLLTSDDADFSHAAEYPLTEAVIRGETYYAAEAALADGSYFTFAEQQPRLQLSDLTLWDGTEVIALNMPYDANTTDGYEAVVPQTTESVRLKAQSATQDAVIDIYIRHYDKERTLLPGGDDIPLATGVNELSIELKNEGDDTIRNTYNLDIIRRLPVDESGKLELPAGSVTASSSQPGTGYVPANVVDGVWGEDAAGMESRWSASGQGQWLQFDLGEPLSVTYLKLAFLNARDRLSSYEIRASNDPSFEESIVALPRRSSRALQAEDSVLQPYVLDNPGPARYWRLIGYGNSASGSSGSWNSLMEAQLYVGEAPVVHEPEEPNGPPAAGDVDEDDLPPPVPTTVRVSSAEQLQQAIDDAVPGTVIEVQSGTYEQDGPFVVLNKTGSAAYPIRITAAEQDEAVIAGNSYFHIENSAYVEVSGFSFRGGIGTPEGNETLVQRGLEHRSRTGVHPGVQLQSSSHVSIVRNSFALNETGQPYSFTAPLVGTVTCLVDVPGSCRIGALDSAGGDAYEGPTPYEDTSLLTSNGTHRHYIRVEGESSHNRLAYNDIGPKKGFGAVVIYDGAGHTGQNISQYDVIEYNRFHGIGPRVTNGLEAIRLGLSSLSLSSGFVTIQYNLFEGVNGEDEIISVKSSDNIIRYNTIRGSYGGIVARHGHRNSFYGNFFFGDGVTPGLSGFRIYGNDHKIYNNYMEGLTDRIIRLDGGTHDAGPDGSANPTVRWGAPEQTAELNSLPPEARTELLRGHWRPYNVQIFNNTIVNVGNNTPAISLGGRTYQPVGTKVYNNLIFSNAGTIFSETSPVQSAPAHERPVYAGNLIEGTAVPTNNLAIAGGFEKTELKLVRSADRLVRLSAFSPAIDAAKAPYVATEDMDGQFRFGGFDVGADEYSPGAQVARLPLTAADVGPNAGPRPPAPEGEPGLRKLELRAGSAELPIGFREETPHYAVTLPSGAASVTVVPTALSDGTVIEVSVDGYRRQTVESGQASEALPIDADGSYILVEARMPSGKQKTYSIEAKRHSPGGGYVPAPSPPSPPPPVEPSPPPTPAPVPRPTEQPEFSDTGRHWGRNPIAEAARRGFAAGYPDGSFRPDEPVTRLQFALMLTRAKKLGSAEPTALFADSNDIPSWAAGPIAAAVQAGILQGYEDGTLRPNERVNRAEMIVMLLRAYPPPGNESAAQPPFEDGTDIPDWAESAVASACAMGIIEGRGDGRLEPAASATRAEAAALLIRMLDR
ncbi:S-layer homology domain-containing protein [Paenibacillus soyae]|uniref:S-layer homology domain-containing protein n=1 Tax=Paenibacillus soyae TaxID=2969249 RepID=A0A9X2SB87_9BACL|nr:S-layer homology domain-containing protein [Paenibacillus soyae]MCR2806795.1 S-layer homology domain-containing protein [Paenibacillus soyae]